MKTAEEVKSSGKKETGRSAKRSAGMDEYFLGSDESFALLLRTFFSMSTVDTDKLEAVLHHCRTPSAFFRPEAQALERER